MKKLILFFGLSIVKLAFSNLTTSVTIPCYNKHAVYLYDLIEHYTRQSVLPNEIVISLSGAKYISNEIVQKIQNKSWPFSLELIISDEEQSEATNRNIVCSRAKYDIIINQDADDLPHPQRIEIVKYFFTNYPIVHLLHGLVFKAVDFKVYHNFADIQCLYFKEPGDIFGQDHPIGNGPSCYRRQVFERIRYDESCKIGSDLRFNYHVYDAFKNQTIVILADIYAYKYELSSYNQSDTVFNKPRFSWKDILKKGVN